MRTNVLFLILFFVLGGICFTSCQKAESKSDRFFAKVLKKELTDTQKKGLKHLVKKLVPKKKKIAVYDSKPWKMKTTRRG